VHYNTGVPPGRRNRERCVAILRVYGAKIRNERNTSSEIKGANKYFLQYLA